MAVNILQLQSHFRRLWRTLRFRLAAWNALVVAVIAMVMLLGLRQGVRWALYHEIDQMLLEEVREISLAIQDANADEFPLLQEDLSRKSVGHQQHGWFAELFDPRGHVLWASEDAPAETPALLASQNLLPYTLGDLRIIEMKIRRGALGIGVIRIGASLDFIKRDIAHIDRLMFIAAATLVLIAPICGYWLAGRAAQTVGDIIHTAARLRPSHLEERLRLRGTGDELDQLAHTINGLLDRIAIYLQHKRDFLANAAHELRTPLAAIRSSIEVALSGDRTSGEYAVVLEDLIDQSTALETLVNQLLLLSETETESGPWQSQQEEVPMHEVVARAVDMFRGVAETREIELNLESIHPAIVFGNRQHLRQVVNNLIDNAIKYSQHGGKIRVHLDTSPVDGTMTLAVHDNGIGISPEDVSHVFERFFRADRSRTRTLAIHGTGLGLSICQAVVNAHGGTITCRSVLHEGTVLEVVLPLARYVSTTLPQATAALPAVDTHQ